MSKTSLRKSFSHDENIGLIGSFKMSKRVALCIGIDEYKYLKSMTLRFAKADAIALSRVLSDEERGGFRCFSFFDEKATKKNIAKGLQNLLSNENLQQDDFALIYYSGHGGLDADSNLYLVASDSKLKAGSRRELDISTCLHIKELEVALDNTKAGTIVFIIDACFSGAFGKALGRIRYRSGANVVFVGACRSDQASVETQLLQHGLFTSCFLDGLNQLPTEGDWITLNQLLSFIEPEMLSHGGQMIEVSAHFTSPRILISRNPLFKIISSAFTGEIQEIFKVDGSKISVFPESSWIFVAEQTVGLHKSKIGVMALDNKEIKITERHIDQFLRSIENWRNRRLIDRGVLVSRNRINPTLSKKIQTSVIADYKTGGDLIRDLMDLEPHLTDIIAKFERGDPAFPRSPPLKKFYVDPFVKVVIDDRKSANLDEEILNEDLSGEFAEEDLFGDQSYHDNAQDSLIEHFRQAGEISIVNALGQETEQVGLMQLVEKWLLFGSSRLAILGEYGFGKTVFCKKLAYEMAKDHRNGKQRRIPILIDLGRFPKVALDMEAAIIDHLSRECNIKNPSWTAFTTMNKAGLFLLIFDGLDEMAIRTSREVLLKNMFEIEKLASAESSKIILTSRPEYFWSRREEEETFKPGEFEQRPSYFRVSLLPFSDEQIELFLKKRIPLIKAAKHKWKYYFDNIRNIYDLPDLSRRPVFLEMISQTLPHLIEEGKPVNRNSLYQQYLMNELRRQTIEKSRTLLLKTEKRWELMALLAFELFRKKLDGLSPSEIMKIVQGHLTEPQRQELEGHISDFLTCSFLRRSENRFGFSHATFKEFLVSETLYKKLQDDQTSDFEKNELTKPIIDFLAEREIDVEILWNWINSTKGKAISKAQNSFLGGNAISILSRKGFAFGGSDLSRAHLLRAKLEKANLAEAKMMNADLSYADLSNCNLREADCRLAEFRGCNLENADISSANLSESDLSGANMRFATLVDVTLMNANLQGANLMGAQLLGAKLNGTDFIGAVLNGAKLDKVDLHNHRFEKTEMKEISLIEADLQGAILIEANLKGANMQGANLSNANLRNANLLGANLRHCDLRGTKLSTNLNDCLLSDVLFNEHTDISKAVIDVNESLKRRYIDEEFAFFIWGIK
jgi:uncharacterized protein YjbI with pentapeptide repeats